jgi:type VI protein secretion system component VasK
MQLVAHWRLWWRRWSTWLAAAYAAVTALIFANPTLLLGLVGFFPGGVRAFAAGAVFVLVFALPVLVANLRQGKLKEKADAARK